MNQGRQADEHYIGMLSGTSRDGVDAVLVNFSHGTMKILHASCVQYPSAIKQKLDQLLATGKPPAGDVASLLSDNLGRFFARVAQNLVREAGMEMRDIRAIGSHGQNVWHQPWGDNPVSLQLGNPDLIAKNTATTTIGNFRSADVQAGGEGAPLAPLLHQKIFSSEEEDRAILNIGGIANLTILPASGGVSGFDCGPGNCLMDAWTARHLHTDYDDNGRWAAKGAVDSELLERMLSDPYFGQPPPKSTGLEHFNVSWLDKMLGNSETTEVDVQTTLAELTALSVAGSLPESSGPARLLVCGGGVHNTFLMRRLAAALPDVIVESTTRYGVDPDWVEGLLFAWLARERLNERSQDTPPITGANHRVLLGDIYEP
jgi:anhydro-N-acetylmuramic acid kinase